MLLDGMFDKNARVPIMRFRREKIRTLLKKVGDLNGAR